MTDLVELVARNHDGSQQAEHGTGLNMAPFVAAEWGEEATAMMWRIKELADPQGILAPNVILTRNRHTYLDNLKLVPRIEDVTGSPHCIECGFCEPVCPSRHVTKWYPGYMSAPHCYGTDRLCIVASGIWWVNSGNDFDPANCVPTPLGSFIRRVAGTPHYDGVIASGAEPAVIASSDVSDTMYSGEAPT